MEPSFDFSKIIQTSDLNSLRNLSKIQEKEVVDVYPDGTVSAPYKAIAGSILDSSTWSYESARSTLNVGWRTMRSMSKWSGNRDDLSKIQELMKRSISCYLQSGSEELLHEIEGAAEGLMTLKNYYAEKDNEIKKNKDYWANLGPLASKGREMLGPGDCEKAVNSLDGVIKYIKSSLHVEKEKIPSTISPERAFELNKFEASNLQTNPEESSIKGINEGIDYYIDRIEKFLLLNDSNLTKDDKVFLGVIKDRLEDSKKNEINYSDHYQEVIRPLRGMVSDEEHIEFVDALKPAYTRFYLMESEKLISKLDSMTQFQSEMGVSMNMVINWNPEEKNAKYNPGHAFLISICKEQDGTYTVAQANAGAFSLGDTPDITGFHFHMKFHNPISLSFPPIVEFKNLSSGEVQKFLILAHEMQYKKLFSIKYKNQTEANGAYNQLFNTIDHKRVMQSRIPSRRAQVIGNCGLRSVKEELIYSFQKAGKIELANNFLKQVATSLEFDFDSVKPLLK